MTLFVVNAALCSLFQQQKDQMEGKGFLQASGKETHSMQLIDPLKLLYQLHLHYFQFFERALPDLSIINTLFQSISKRRCMHIRICRTRKLDKQENGKFYSVASNPRPTLFPILFIT